MIFLSLTFAALLLNISVNCQQPSADYQCKILTNNINAQFCQAYSSTICTSLVCRSTALGDCASIGYAPVANTFCASGKVCQNGNCVTNSSGTNDTCLYGDDVVTQSMLPSISLPYSQMSCPDLMAYLVYANQSPFAFCANSTLRQSCCDTCKVYDKFTCKDIFPIDCFNASNLCSVTSTLIKGYSIYAACPRTCGVCSQSQLKCSNSLCMNGATCIDVGATNNYLFGFFCNCATGYFGQFCQIKNPCSPNPCKNSGTCSFQNALNYACQCKAGYYGGDCSLTYTTTIANTGCLSNPCRNGAYCVSSSASSYSCLCASGYWGTNCQYIDGCVIYPCRNGGTCNIGLTVFPYYTCTCPSNYGGSNCQTNKVTTTAPSCVDQDASLCVWLKANGFCGNQLLGNGQTVNQYCASSCTSCGTITTAYCVDTNSTLCNLIKNTNICNTYHTINNIPVQTYCAASCSSTCQTTTTACVDGDSTFCQANVDICDALNMINPLPCRKTCGKC